MPFPFFFQYFWLIVILFQTFNAALFWYRCQPIIAERPELADPAHKVLIGFHLLGYLPWLALGAGICFGGTKGLLSIFRPGDGDPFVLAFWMTGFCLQLVAFYWVVLCDGAEQMALLPDVIRLPVQSPLMMRLFICFGLLMNFTIFLVLCFVDMPVG